MIHTNMSCFAWKYFFSLLRLKLKSTNQLLFLSERALKSTLHRLRFLIKCLKVWKHRITYSFVENFQAFHLNFAFDDWSYFDSNSSSFISCIVIDIFIFNFVLWIIIKDDLDHLFIFIFFFSIIFIFYLLVIFLLFFVTPVPLHVLTSLCMEKFLSYLQILNFPPSMRGDPNLVYYPRKMSKAESGTIKDKFYLWSI